MPLPEPYYTSPDGRIVLYCADCRDVLPHLEPGSIDAVVTDPPYGVGLVAKNNRRALRRARTLYHDDPEEVRALIAETVPLLRRVATRALIFPGSANAWAYPQPDAVGCVYVPTGKGRAPWGFQCCHLILYYGPDPYLAAGLGCRPNSFSAVHGGAGVRALIGEMNAVDHPCPKPLSWMRWAVARASLPGELVLDPFAGSGTTLVAAQALGRRAIGIEIEEAYCRIAVERLRQQPLPLPEPEPVRQPALLGEVT